MLVNDTEHHVDHEQGVPHFKGFAGRIDRLPGPPAHMAHVLYQDQPVPPVPA